MTEMRVICFSVKLAYNVQITRSVDSACKEFPERGKKWKTRYDKGKTKGKISKKERKE
jgi:hypothetical protein